MTRCFRSICINRVPDFKATVQTNQMVKNLIPRSTA